MSPFEPELDRELRLLKDENQDLRQVLQALEQKVALLAREVGIISQWQTAVEESDAYGRKRATHIPQLPLEVLRSIFIHCLPAEGNAALSPHEPSLLLGRVCRLWRDLAWSTPELWDTLHIVIPNLDYDPFLHEPSKWHGYIVAIESWLKRSGTRPLSLSLVDEQACDFGDDHSCTELIAEIIQQISTESARLKNLRLQLRGKDMKLHSQAFLSDSFPVLEAFAFRTLNETLVGLDIYPPDYNRHDIGFHPIIASPSLRTLHLGDVSLLGIYTYNGPRMNDYSNIVDLSLGDDSRTTGFSVLSISDALSILTQLQNTQLRACRLVLRPILAVPPPAQINLCSLRTFTVIVPNAEPVEERYREPPANDEVLEQHLFSPLYLPSLHSFEYHNQLRGFQQGESTFPFLALLSKPHQLETLKLYASASQDSVKRLLQLCASVKELHLSAEFSAHAMFMIGTAFPNLETLRLDCSPPVDREQLLLDISDDRGVAWPRVWQDLPGPTLNRLIEKARHTVLDERLDYIQSRFQHGSQSTSEGDRRPPLRRVDFRLNERLRPRALATLAPYIENGLTVCFREDYFDFPPPPRHLHSPGKSWNIFAGNR